ncbi:MAG: RluA family pseudouridine synthase [Patescibacteria group bacterium]
MEKAQAEKIIISESDENIRLDKFLVQHFSDLSRSQIQKLIQQEKVLVNQKPANKKYLLKINDNITINFIKQEIEIKKPDLSPNKNITLDIVFEDENYLVLNKPANLIVHPSVSHSEGDTLINALIHYYPEITEVGEDELRPGIVHRLDKEVSGLMVIAKTQAAFLDLKDQFQDRKIYKEYIALVHGIPTKDQDIIKLNISRSIDGHKMAAQPGVGKKAITEYEIIEKYNNFALLKVVIKTGRTHQIRVHLNAIGYPVVGDQIYKPKKLITRVKLDRIFLHSHKLEFSDISGEKMSFSKDLPQELTRLINSFIL